MPNYTTGKDSVKTSWDISPKEETYNGLIRINTGLVEGDGTGDPIRSAIHKLLVNADKTITEENLDTLASPNKVVKRDNQGDIYANRFFGSTSTGNLEDLGFNSGTIDCGTW